MESEFKRFWSLHLLTAFEEALYEDSDEYLWAHPQINVLQYVLRAPDLETCQEATGDLLQELSQLGYRVSAKKAQLFQLEVTYLGYIFKGANSFCQTPGGKPSLASQSHQPKGRYGNF